jgi:hypothetical protein
VFVTADGENSAGPNMAQTKLRPVEIYFQIVRLRSHSGFVGFGDLRPLQSMLTPRANYAD